MVNELIFGLCTLMVIYSVGAALNLRSLRKELRELRKVVMREGAGTRERFQHELATLIVKAGDGARVTLPLEAVVRAAQLMERARNRNSNERKAIAAQSDDVAYSLPRLSISEILRSEYPELSGAADKQRVIEDIEEGFEPTLEELLQR